MRTIHTSAKLLTLLLTAVLILAWPKSPQAQNLPLANGFAHNDYWHKRPLLDALDNGYQYIEADIFLVDGELIVAHVFPFFKSNRTLEKLYLQPLAERIKKDPHDTYPVTLMIDIKTGSKKTYAALKLLLEKYRSIITAYNNGKVLQRQLTIVLSGHKPIKTVIREQQRMVFIDQDLRHMETDTLGYQFYQMASCPYGSLLKWNGQGKMPDTERTRLAGYVKTAHRHGKKVRLWASPENKNVWGELLRCGVDLINTDQLSTLREFLTTTYADAGR